MRQVGRLHLHLASSKVSVARLRDYEEADLPALHALDQVCFPAGIAYSFAELRSFLNHPSSFAAVAADGDQIAGFAIVRPVRRKLHRSGSVLPTPVLHVLTIDVAPQARRQGIGGLLMRWIFRKGAELRARAVVLEVAADNHTAQRFYEHQGFNVTGAIPGYYNGIMDALELEHVLEAVPRSDAAAG